MTKSQVYRITDGQGLHRRSAKVRQFYPRCNEFAAARFGELRSGDHVVRRRIKWLGCLKAKAFGVGLSLLVSIPLIGDFIPLLGHQLERCLGRIRRGGRLTGGANGFV